MFAWSATLQVWAQCGSDIDGEAEGDVSGWSVAMSADGDVAAVGAMDNDDAGPDAGHARVFAWSASASEWMQRGSDIDAEAAGDNSGFSVALSSDGNVLAVGALANDGTGTNVDHVRVYAWSLGSQVWAHRGSTSTAKPQVTLQGSLSPSRRTGAWWPSGRGRTAARMATRAKCACSLGRLRGATGRNEARTWKASNSGTCQASRSTSID